MTGSFMAQKVHVSLVDDYDGTEATETVTFGLDGVTYEIDLSEENAQSLRDAVHRYAEKARRTGGRKPNGAQKGRTVVDPSQTKAIREWAQANGHQVSGRGRISADIVTAYEQAHTR